MTEPQPALLPLMNFPFPGETNLGLAHKFCFLLFTGNKYPRLGDALQPSPHAWVELIPRADSVIILRVNFLVCSCSDLRPWRVYAQLTFL